MKQKTLYIVAISIFVSLQVSTFAQKTTREEYIQRFTNIVLEHQDIYGIPASIKMAQAIFESGNGNSRLATQANNHFGIKCKKDWVGESISHDDDAIAECFRKYNSDEESFKDHSKFLDESPRYESLFNLDPMDYKGWARGLKAAGYATNPKYADMLITLIEDNQLYLLDQGKDIVFEDKQSKPISETESRDTTQKRIDLDNYTITISGHFGYKTYSNNGSEFIITEKGDSFASLSSNLKISEKKLRKFNDMPNEQISPNSILYIKSKAKRVNNGKLMHYVKDGDSMHTISQIYGVKLKNLYKLNRLQSNSKLTIGQQIRLM